jgi:hypothetical protein
MSLVMVTAIVASSAQAATETSCRHYTSDVWFYGKHVASGAAGVVLDEGLGDVLEKAPPGVQGSVFVVTEVEVLVVPPEQSNVYPIGVGQRLRILQEMGCSNCNSGSLLHQNRRGPYSLIGETRWFSAAPPPKFGEDAVASAVRDAGISYDLWVDSFCDVATEKQVETPAAVGRDEPPPYFYPDYDPAMI